MSEPTAHELPSGHLATGVGVLHLFCRLTPLADRTAVADAIRVLVNGGPTAGPVLEAVLWLGGICLVSIPLAIAGYRKVT